MTKRLFNIRQDDDAEYIAHVFYDVIANKACLSKECLQSVCSQFMKTFCQKKGSMAKKCEQIYLDARSRYHFDLTPKCCYSTPCVVPLQSISAFKALYSSLDWFHSYKFVFDLLHEINPEVAAFEYESMKDNVDCALFSDYPFLQFGNEVTEDWLNSRAGLDEYSFMVRNGGDSYRRIKNIDESDFVESIYDEAYDYLRYCITNKLLSYQDGICIFHALSNQKKKNFHNGLSFYKKLSSLANLDKILKGRLINKFTQFTPSTYHFFDDLKLFIMK